jgi:hypothetical protein
MKAKRFVVMLVAVPLAAGGVSAGVAWAGAAAPAKVKAPAAKVKPAAKSMPYAKRGAKRDHQGRCHSDARADEI